MPHRSTTRLLMLLAVLLSGVSPVGASGRTVWGIEQEEFTSRLANANYDFLRHINFARYDYREALRLGDEAPFLLARIYAELELPRVAERLDAVAWEGGGEPWRRYAVEELLASHAESESYAELETLAREASGAYEEPEIHRYLVEALYRLQKDKNALQEIEHLETMLGPDDDPEGELRQEIALWRSVIASRLNTEGWPDRYRRVYRDFPASEIHSRIWLYLQARPALREPFSPAEIDFFRVKQRAAEGDADKALDLLMRIVDVVTHGPDGDHPAALDLIRSPYGLLELYRAGSSANRRHEAAELLGRLATGSSVEIERRIREYIGRLYRLSGSYRSAEEALRRSLELQQPGADEQRVRWYLMSVLADFDPLRLVNELDAGIPLVGEPGYFSDVLSELARRLVGLGAFDELQNAYSVIRGFATPGTLAHYELPLAVAIRDGRLPTDGGPESDPTAYLESVAAQREDLFAALIAATQLGRDGVDQLGIRITGPESPRGGVETDLQVLTGVAAELDAYLRYGLLSYAYERVASHRGPVDAAVLAALSERLAGAGRISESIAVAGRLARSEGASMRRETAELLYPTAFAPIVIDASRTESIDPWLLFALIREESRFDADVVSVAGAVGLTQLLPSTAEDVARRMRLSSADPADPLDNVRVGTRYLRMLTDQFGDTMKALAAYNGGPGRMRQWESRWSEYDGLLLHLALPFAETHNHIRKIVVSASYYGYLFGNRSPAETVRLVFPELDQQSEGRS